jgi:hypothetical protein
MQSQDQAELGVTGTFPAQRQDAIDNPIVSMYDVRMFPLQDPSQVTYAK